MKIMIIKTAEKTLHLVKKINLIISHVICITTLIKTVSIRIECISHVIRKNTASETVNSLLKLSKRRLRKTKTK